MKIENPFKGVLSSKICIPCVPKDYVHRERLDELLNLGMKVPWTIVSAGAGYGKTTLVAEWLQKTKHQAAWLSLDEFDNDPYRFIMYVGAACCQTWPHIGQQVISLFAGVSETNFQTLWIELVNIWIDSQALITIVFDDYHVIVNPEIQQFFSALAKTSAPNIRCILLTRGDSPIPLARLRLQEKLVEMHRNDLQFTANEAEQFLQFAVKKDVEREQLNQLYISTEGWIAGLKIGAVSLKKSSSRTIPKGNLQSVFMFFYEEVWANLSLNIRDFLIKTAILTELSAPVIDRLLLRTDSQQTLEELEASNLFTVLLDGAQKTYRYHHLFREVLQIQLSKSVHSENICQLHRHASQIFAENGEIDKAIKHAMESKDWPYTINLILQQADIWMLRGQEERFLRCMMCIPLAQQHLAPQLWMKQLWALANSLRIEELRRVLEISTEALSSHSDSSIRAEFELFLGIRFLEEGQIKLASEHFIRAQEGFTENQFFLQNVRSMQIANVHLVHDEIAESRTVISKLPLLNQEPSDPWMPYISYWWTAQLELMLGNLRSGLQMLNELAEKVINFGPDPLPNNFAVCLMSIAAGELERGNFELATEFVDRALEILDPEIDPMNTARLLLVQARLEALRQPHELAWVKVLDHACQLPRIHNYPRIYHRLEAMRVRLALYSQSPVDPMVAIERWWGYQGVKERQHAIFKDVPDFICRKSFPLLTLAKAWLQQNNIEQAKAITESCVQSAMKAGRKLCAVEGYLLLAEISRRIDEINSYQHQLKTALDLAYSERMIAPFLEYSPQVICDTENLATCLGYTEFIRYLPKVSREQEQIVKEKMEDTLSLRECEVLKFVSQGFSNAEIGRELFIAPSTVKKHLEHIYAKLGVRRRTQALVRARELGLISSQA